MKKVTKKNVTMKKARNVKTNRKIADKILEGSMINCNLQRIGGIIDYIEEHRMEEKLDLDSIAKDSGYSKYHLHRMFTSIVGAGIHQYIQRRRLTEAARELVTEKKSILEIALDAGYDTQRTFTKAFESLYGETPNQYRKQVSFCRYS